MFVIEKQNIYIINVKKNVSYCFGLAVLTFFCIIRNNFGFKIQLGDKRKRYENAFRLWKLMVLIILVVNSKIGAHVKSNLYYLICLRHFIRSSAAKNRIFLRKALLSIMRAQHFLSYHLIYVP